MNMSEKENAKKLIKLLRQKQAKLGVSYLTTESYIYKTFRLLFYIAFGVLFIINMLYLLSVYVDLNVVLTNAGELDARQITEVSAIKNTLSTVLIMTVIMVLSAVFMILKSPLLQLIFSFVSSLGLIFAFATGLSQQLEGGNYDVFIFRHVLPLLLFVIFSIITAIIHIRQNILDKKGCNEIADSIYRKYSNTAQNINEEQWALILAEYQPLTKSKKRSVKARIRKSSEKENLE